MDTDHEVDLVAAAAVTAVNIIIRRRRRRRRNRTVWVREWISRRTQQGAYANLVAELRDEDPRAFKNFVRMDLSTFTELAHLVCPLITKETTNMRKPIAPEERLAVTLRYLASDLEYLYRISATTLSNIIPETCAAMKDALAEDYLKCPNSQEAWKQISNRFSDKWNFPHCLGAFDGKHVRIKKPNLSGSAYYNYKSYFSIVLLALVDADYKFVYVDIGKNGRESDKGIYKNCTFNLAYESQELGLPPPEVIPDSGLTLPYVFVGDDAFTLKEIMMKPFAIREMTHDERIFNYRLSRARRIVENAFGILANRFRIFLRGIESEPEKVEKVIWAACCLHNFLRTKVEDVYMPRGSIDIENVIDLDIIEGSWRMEPCLDGLQQQGSNHYSNDANDVRKAFRNYFVSDQGKVEWQERMI